jgi:polysaccharide export outer membrane protein
LTSKPRHRQTVTGTKPDTNVGRAPRRSGTGSVAVAVTAKAVAATFGLTVKVLVQQVGHCGHRRPSLAVADTGRRWPAERPENAAAAIPACRGLEVTIGRKPRRPGLPSGAGRPGLVGRMAGLPVLHRHCMNKKIARLLSLPVAGYVLVVVALGGCVVSPRFDQQVNAAPEIIRSSVRFQKEYLLVEGDQIEVSVWRTPEVSRTVMIRSDGHISLPLLQEVKAAGLTPRELADQLRTALSARLVNPEVNVITTNVRQPTVYVLGDAKNPGAYPLRNAVTVVQAIALAGGTLRSANENDINLIRLSADGYLEALPMSAATPSQVTSPFMVMAATPLKADDIIFIPESGRSEVVRAVNDLLAPFTIYVNFKLLEKVN